jgi:hypothetical protein
MNSHISGASFGAATISTAVLAAVVLLGSPGRAFVGRVGRFGGAYPAGGYGRAGGASFRFGGDGFAGGNPNHTSWSRSSQSYHPYGTNAENAYSTNQAARYNYADGAHSTNQAARYNEANSLNQSRYNEAQSMQNEHYQNESALSHQQYNQVSNLQSNSNGHWDPYGGCCGSSSGSAAGAAAVGMMGGMAMGAAMRSAAAPRQPTTVVENVQAPAAMPIGTTVPMLPPGAAPTQVNGTEYFYANGNYFRPVFNGSQVVYVATAM